jgi:imidazolonepropionase-like amidohydrolase
MKDKTNPGIKIKKCLAFIFILFFAAHPVMSKTTGTTAIICGKLIDGTGDAPSMNRVIIIKNGKISAITLKNKIPANTAIIDLSGYTVLPGLIDAHVHPLIATDDYQVDHLRRSSADKALQGLKVVQELLYAGWTTLRIAGDADVHYAHFAIRDAINNGLFPGPRIYGAGHYISVTGGGGDINFIAPEQRVLADGLIIDGVDAMRNAVRKEIKHGSDWVKVLVTGAFMSAGDNPKDVHFSPEELKAVVEEANRRGIPVMSHAHSAEGIKMSIKAGVRSVEHGTFIDDEGIRMMVREGTYLIPTLAVGEYYLNEKPHTKALEKFIKLTKKYSGIQEKQVSNAIKAGVKICVGSDYVGFPPTYSAKEFSILVRLGMTPMQAILAGTLLNAELLGKKDEIGSLEAGKYADIIAVKGDPLKDISELERVKFVMKGGRVVKRLSQRLE